uniref:Uncharacterized protein n=1 Tax=Salix viminalis TaxID=40686 RepID=A0A6N2L0K2_SALVM
MNALAVILEVPRYIWRQTLKPLSDFGFGRRSIWEGGVGLFLVSGAVLVALSLAWLRGFYCSLNSGSTWLCLNFLKLVVFAQEHKLGLEGSLLVKLSVSRMIKFSYLTIL